MKKYLIFLPLIASCNELGTSNNMNKSQSKIQNANENDAMGRSAYESVCDLYKEQLTKEEINPLCNTDFMKKFMEIVSCCLDKLKIFLEDSKQFQTYDAKVSFLCSFLSSIMDKKKSDCGEKEMAEIAEAAVKKNFPELVEALCKNEVDMAIKYNNSPNHAGCPGRYDTSILYSALQLGDKLKDYTIFHTLIKYQPKLLDAKTINGKTALHQAISIRRRDFCIVEKLVHSGADINIVCNGETPLELAMDQDHFKAFLLLFKETEKIKNVYNSDLLNRAIRSIGGNVPISSYIAEQHPEWIITQGPSGDIPLHTLFKHRPFSESCNLETQNYRLNLSAIFYKLCKNKDWTNLRDKEGKTPLDLATPELQTEIQRWDKEPERTDQIINKRLKFRESPSGLSLQYSDKV